MNAQAILRSLQEGNISLAEAKHRLSEASRQEQRLAEGPVSAQDARQDLSQEIQDSIPESKWLHKQVSTTEPKLEREPSPRPSGPTRDSYDESNDEAARLKRDSDAIAIIGMSGQFPQANTMEQFWSNLAEGRDCISEVPADRWDMSFYDADPKTPGKSYSKWMGVLEEADQFDPHFFQLSPAEAELMDPQQRLFLEHCWRSLEDAGIAPSSLAGSRCGVFAGCSVNDYDHLMGNEGMSAYGLVGRSIAILPARISYFLNLKGPCLAIDTSCSASLVAIAEACNSLKLGDSDLALAGGVCVLTNPAMHIMTSKAGMLSPDGRCFTFDNRANGFVPGEGVGVILLKRLADAVRDEDLIYGVIRGWGVNQDGRTNGITAPSGQSQSELERDVYERFGIDPESITMVETHGTGTRLGDPIEVEALTAAFQTYTQKKGYCALGSVKSNIGHLLTAAGAAGVIKVLLSMQHKLLPPTIHFEALNDHITLSESPFYVNTQLRPWNTAASAPRRAAVSSFGFSGTNAHLVIEEYVSSAQEIACSTQVLSQVATQVVAGNVLSSSHVAAMNAADARRSTNARNDGSVGQYVFPLSAPDADGLIRYANMLRKWISSKGYDNPELVKSLAYTLQTGREPMKERVVIIAAHVSDLLLGLESYLNNQTSPHVITKRHVSDTSLATADTPNVYTSDALNTGTNSIGSYPTAAPTFAAYSKTSLHWQGPQSLRDGLPPNDFKHLIDVANTWVNGGIVPWREQYTNSSSSPVRLRLPGYPLRKERYWVRYASADVAPTQQIQAPTHHAYTDARTYVYELLARHSIGIQSNQSVNSLDEGLPFIQLGLDSLVAIHIQNMIMKDFGLEVTMVQLMDGLNTRELIQLLEGVNHELAIKQTEAVASEHSSGAERRQWLDIEHNVPRMDQMKQREYGVPGQKEKKQDEAVWMEL
ncbi:beta-ketoacyl synthase N-terminal-like domain-containing protein [Paenibacillus sp. UMB4589-SE434]|uniref:type I polyketide synthase n=1 Tax=Paenibacillus sp. UMB4589-SE434 TaxID=3046314 RepID=UPI00254BC236|nr:beta-ketoacyl synthase N-terminal-like domain-containing protein [Paenibacillus sp. UMB4589-SE434]MDK8181883.1 beta-ketoacyl synthase N-terminal-like domain-containing protein [Paenibacillus sp. UMB4589-SE434]